MREDNRSGATADGQMHDVTRPQVPAHLPAPQPPGRKKKILLTAGILAVALTVWWFARRGQSTGAAPGAAGGPRGQMPPVPVLETAVSSRDVPIYLDGLGTVQAFNSVTVRSRVDGQLVQVAFTEGEDVKTGDVLAVVDRAPYQAVLDQALAKKAQDEAQLANARVDLERYAELLRSDSITRQVHDTQKALVSQLEATVKADQASIDSAKVNLDYTTIRAPIDGRVGLRQVDAGNIVHASDSTGLVVLNQLRPISIVFTLPEQALTRLQQYQSAGQPFVVLAVARDNTNVLAQGKLAVIDNQIDTSTGTLRLKATFENEDLRLWPGQFVNTRLLLTTRQGAPVVPASAVQRGPEGTFVFVIQEDQTVQLRPVQVGPMERGEALIESGLRPGEQVVADGQYKLQPGSRVKPAEAPRRRTEGGASPAAPAAHPGPRP